MIVSRQNEKVKELFKLLQKKHRDKTGMFLVFGEHGILEAEKTNNIVEIYTVNNSKKGVLIDKKIIKELAPLSSPTERVAIVKKPSVKPYSDKVLIIDGIQDPGNLGTLIRSAVGFGFSSIIANEDTVDFYNDKVVSAAQGNLFYANLIRKDLVEEIKELKKKGYKIIGTDVDKGKKIKSLNKNVKMGLILGNEGVGIKEEIYKLADEFVKIETSIIESLNVSVAGSIIMYEVNSKND